MRTAPEVEQPSDSPKKSSTATKLVQAVALAAVLVPLGTVAIESSTITCSFGSFSGCTVDSGYGGGFGTDYGAGAVYQFDPDGVGGNDYYLKLTFDQINGDFDVTITDFLRTEAEMAAKFAANFPNVVCTQIYDGSLGSFCVEFDITAPDPGEDTWESSDSPFLGWRVDLAWFADTDIPGATFLVLKDSGPSDGIYDEDITIPGSYTTAPDFCSFDPLAPGCITLLKAPGDPGISGQDNDFSAVSVGQVPEPISVALLGTGLAGLLYRRVRRRSGRRDP
jgi:PEP-CTERM motif